MLKKYILLLFLSSFLFSDYKVTQYQGASRYGRYTKEWTTERVPYNIAGANTTIIRFTDKKTGQTVYVSIPFEVVEINYRGEEL